jgi:superfamily I DNA/RNA helicase
VPARSFQYLSGLTVLITHILTVALVDTANRFSDLTDQIGRILIIIPITPVYRQSRQLRELSDAFAALFDAVSADPTEPAKGEDEADLRPLLAEGLQGEDLARWLADRIVEVEAGVGSLPSIAVFVDDGASIDPLAEAVRKHLKPHNIAIMGYKDGLVVGDEREVRVFDVRHVKGMEFEAVFFVGVDGMASRIPEMFHRFVYVGITRAATYLGVTCARRLPPVLEPVRSHFSDTTWAAARAPVTAERA